MKPSSLSIKRKVPIKKIIAFAILLILSLFGTFIYINLNRLISESLLKAFNSNIISDVYELQFEKLNVNLFEGNIYVKNVRFQKREKPLKNYPYINSSIKLSTEILSLKKVQLLLLVREGRLELEEIVINKPKIELILDGEKSNFFPYKDSSLANKMKDKKRAIIGFKLNQFQLTGASFRGNNLKKENKFEIQDFSITLKDLLLDQQAAKDLMSFKHVELSVGASHTEMNHTLIKQASFQEFHLSIDSLKVEKSIDTLIYRFKDIKTGLNGLDIQTADSINHISLSSLDISYTEKYLKLRNLLFKPNISNAQIQKKFKYQKVNASGSVGKMEIRQINFDSLLYFKKVYIDEILLDSVTVYVFKDKLKPIDKKRFPEYFGQDIRKIPIPLSIRNVKATRVTLFSAERKADSSYAKVALKRASAQIEHITNLATNKPFVMKADAYIDNKVHFNMALNFSYLKPHFSFNGSFNKFNLTDLNPLLNAYTPAKVIKGIVDELVFSGNAEHTKASGTMKFLYHDLSIDLELHNKKKWKSAVITFAANTVLPSSNPGSEGAAPRIVNFHIERDMNKAFINVIIKSVLNGLKETMIMSKENKKKHHEETNKNKHHLFKKKNSK